MKRWLSDKERFEILMNRFMFHRSFQTDLQIIFEMIKKEQQARTEGICAAAEQKIRRKRDISFLLGLVHPVSRNAGRMLSARSLSTAGIPHRN